MIYNVQALRALAALMVVVVHCRTVLAPDLGAWTECGRWGVDLFFVISGFIMIHTQTRRPLGASAFLLNRLVRVVPLYWSMTAVVFVVALSAPHLFGATRALTDEFVQSLLFIPFAKANGAIRPMLFVGWSLEYEMLFYLLFAAAIAMGARRIEHVAGLVSVALASLCLAGLMGHPKSAPGIFFSSPMLLEFVWGMAVGLAVKRGWHVPAMLGLPLFLGCAAVMLTQHWLLSDMMRSPAAGLVTGLMLWTAISMELQGGVVVRAARVQLMGTASYSLYLIHPFVIQGFAKISDRVANAPVSVALTAIAVLVCVPCAVLCHRWLEVPLGSIMHAWLRPRFNAAPA
ncbi:MAG: acyltransferase family protein [Janthinobacterium lividum]